LQRRKAKKIIKGVNRSVIEEGTDNDLDTGTEEEPPGENQFGDLPL